MRKSNGLRKRDARGGAGTDGGWGRQVAQPPPHTPDHLPGADRPPGSSNVGIRAVGEGAAKQQSGIVVLAAGVGATAASPAASAAPAATRLVLQSRVELHQYKHLKICAENFYLD